MKSFTRLAVIILACGPVWANDSSPCDDPYAVGVVKRVLSSPTGMASSFGEKEISRLGDRAAIAMVKIFSKEDLVKPSTMNKVLPIVRVAFERPKIVAYEKDRSPDFTLILLRYLLDSTADRKSKQDIENTIRYVSQKAAGAAQDTGS